MANPDALSPDERARVDGAIRAAEAKARIELMVAVSPRSGDYTRWLVAPVAFATVGLALAAHALLPNLTFGWLLGLQLPVAAALWALLTRWRSLALVFVPDGVEKECVRREALRLFAAHAVFETRERTGVLIYVSTYERRVEILADTGLVAHVKPDAWQEDARLLSAKIAIGEAALGLCEAAARIADRVAASLPAEGPRRNELPEIV